MVLFCCQLSGWGGFRESTDPRISESRDNFRVSLRAAGIEEFGGEVAPLELPEPPPPKTGEALIEVRAAGVAIWDEFVRTGDWDVGQDPPLALGVEAAGVVVEVGPGVEWPATGTEVTTHPLPLPYQGCWAQAGAFPVPALTAHQVVSEVLDVQPDETVLVNGAAGVTGGMIVELAARSGATVIATASEGSAARVMALGAGVVLDYHDPEWTSRAIDAAGSSGIQAAANAASGGEADAMSVLVNGGRLATITGAPPPTERGISIADVYVRPDGDELGQLAASLAEGTLHVEIAASYPLARAAEGFALATKGAGGAVVLEP
jgi:NADPH:quinone reductase-like Zn-dependent oxidoreductase